MPTARKRLTSLSVWSARLTGRLVGRRSRKAGEAWTCWPLFGFLGGLLPEGGLSEGLAPPTDAGGRIAGLGWRLRSEGGCRRRRGRPVRWHGRLLLDERCADLVPGLACGCRCRRLVAPIGQAGLGKCLGESPPIWPSGIGQSLADPGVVFAHPVVERRSPSGRRCLSQLIQRDLRHLSSRLGAARVASIPPPIRTIIRGRSVKTRPCRAGQSGIAVQCILRLHASAPSGRWCRTRGAALRRQRALPSAASSRFSRPGQRSGGKNRSRSHSRAALLALVAAAGVVSACDAGWIEYAAASRGAIQTSACRLRPASPSSWHVRRL
jgi:hypothetical protein